MLDGEKEVIFDLFSSVEHGSSVKAVEESVHCCGPQPVKVR
jgi:hypothetical protein